MKIVIACLLLAGVSGCASMPYGNLMHTWKSDEPCKEQYKEDEQFCTDYDEVYEDAVITYRRNGKIAVIKKEDHWAKYHAEDAPYKEVFEGDENYAQGKPFGEAR